MKRFTNIRLVRKAINIEEVKEQTKRIQYPNRDEMIASKEIILTPKKYEELTNDLLKDNEMFQGLELRPNHCVWIHTKKNKGILVDNQGYEYARYVAIVE